MTDPKEVRRKPVSAKKSRAERSTRIGQQAMPLKKAPPQDTAEGETSPTSKLADRSVNIFGADIAGTARYVDAYCHAGSDVGIHTQDLGTAPEVFGTGSNEYEFFTYVERESADVLLIALLKDGACLGAAGPEKDALLLALLKQRFGGTPTAAEGFEKFAEANGIKWSRFIA